MLVGTATSNTGQATSHNDVDGGAGGGGDDDDDDDDDVACSVSWLDVAWVR